MEVKELMNPSVVTIEPTASAALAARLISRHNVGALPVCGADRRLRGMVTDRDIVLRCVAAEEDPAQTLVRDIMTRHSLWNIIPAPAARYPTASRSGAGKPRTENRGTLAQAVRRRESRLAPPRQSSSRRVETD